LTVWSYSYSYTYIGKCNEVSAILVGLLPTNASPAAAWGIISQELTKLELRVKLAA
jgi:hypothetical protein